MRPKFTYTYGKLRYNFLLDEILHRDGEWYIRKPRNEGTDWPSYIHHSVTKNILQQNPWVDGKKPDPPTYLKKIGCEWADIPLWDNRCTMCHNTIPEGIVALWKLHNYERIQKGNCRG